LIKFIKDPKLSTRYNISEIESYWESDWYTRNLLVNIKGNHGFEFEMTIEEFEKKLSDNETVIISDD
jgi:hypothetical protein